MKYVVLVFTVLVSIEANSCICSLIDNSKYVYIAEVRVVDVCVNAYYEQEIECYLAEHRDKFDDSVLPPPPPLMRQYDIEIETIDQIKGGQREHLIVYGGNQYYGLGMTSCDLDLRIGDVWILYAFDSLGDIMTGYCTKSKLLCR